jgi:hypothetical protein
MRSGNNTQRRMTCAAPTSSDAGPPLRRCCLIPVSRLRPALPRASAARQNERPRPNEATVLPLAPPGPQPIRSLLPPTDAAQSPMIEAHNANTPPSHTQGIAARTAETLVERATQRGVQ